MPDRAYRNVLGAFAFTALAFGAMLRIPSRSPASSTLWIEMAFVSANLIAMDWIVIRLYRQIRRLQAGATESPAAQRR